VSLEFLRQLFGGFVVLVGEAGSTTDDAKQVKTRNTIRKKMAATGKENKEKERNKRQHTAGKPLAP